MLKNPSVSIITVTWNSAKDIVNCINSIKKQTYTDFEILLVDNNSNDNSVDIVRKHYQDIQIIENKNNLGFAEGNNIGIQKASGEILAFVNPDVILDPDWLNNLVTKLQSSNKIGGVVGKIFYMGEKYPKDAIFCTWSKIDPFTATPYNFTNNEPASKVDYLSGAAMLVKKEIIDTVGLLDSNYFLYFEETDWCARMIRAGYDLIYVPNALSWHAVSTSTHSDEKIFYMERNRIRFAIKNFDIMYFPVFFIVVVIEMFGLVLRDLFNKNFKRTKIRLRAIKWNISEFSNTLKIRNKEKILLQKSGNLKSYNKSLPLRKFNTRHDFK